MNLESKVSYAELARALAELEDVSKIRLRRALDPDLLWDGNEQQLVFVYLGHKCAISELSGGHQKRVLEACGHEGQIDLEPVATSLRDYDRDSRLGHRLFSWLRTKSQEERAAAARRRQLLAAKCWVLSDHEKADAVRGANPWILLLNYTSWGFIALVAAVNVYWALCWVLLLAPPAVFYAVAGSLALCAVFSPVVLWVTGRAALSRSHLLRLAFRNWGVTVRGSY